MSEKTPKHISQLTNTLEQLKNNVIMYGFDVDENTDKKIPMNLFMVEFDKINNRLDALEGNVSSTLVNLDNFALASNAGFNTLSHSLVFTATINPNIWPSMFSTLNIKYGSTTVNLLESGALKAGVELAEGGLLTIDLTNYTGEFTNTWTSPTTTFELNILLEGGQIDSKTVTYYTFTPIDLVESSFTLTNSLTDWDTERIDLNAMLTGFALSNLNVITATLSYSSGIPDRVISITSNTVSDNYELFSLMLVHQDVTLTITQTVGNDPVNIKSDTTHLDPAYSQIQFVNPLTTNHTTVIIDTPTNITFSATVTRSLKNISHLWLYSTADLETYPIDLLSTGSITGTTINKHVSLVLSESNTFYLVIEENRLNSPGTTWLTQSNSKTINVSTQEGDPLYWGTIDSNDVGDIIGITENDLLAVILAKGIVSHLVDGVAVSNLFLDTNVFNINSLNVNFNGTFYGTGQLVRNWIAIPATKYTNGFNAVHISGFPPLSLANNAIGNFYYTHSMTINGISYYLYYRNSAVVSENRVFVNIT